MKLYSRGSSAQNPDTSTNTSTSNVLVHPARAKLEHKTTKIWHWTIVIWAIFLIAVVWARCGATSAKSEAATSSPIPASNSDLRAELDEQFAIALDGATPQMLASTTPVVQEAKPQGEFPVAAVVDPARAEIEAIFPEQIRDMMAQTLYGEAALPWITSAQQSMVIWCILNRYDSGEPWFSDGYGDLYHIITKPGQFQGYNPSHPVLEECREIVDDVIDRYIAEKLGETDVGRTLPADIPYFTGDGEHNSFFRLSDGWLNGSKVLFGTQPLCDPYTIAN